MKDREETKRKKTEEDARRPGSSNPQGGHTKTPAKGQGHQQPQKNPTPRPTDEDVEGEENDVQQRRRA